MKKISPYWLLLLLLAICFTLATLFVPRANDWKQPPQTGNVLITLLGGRQALGNQLFVMGDVYFHSGYYPSFFDKQNAGSDVADPAHGRAEDAGDDFLGPPKDWIEALGRHFVPNRHTHLSSGGANGHAKKSSVQEILPWMKLAAEMNPQMIESYTVGAYWLRRLHKPEDARQFLLEGLRANPGNPQLFFDLGWLYETSYCDTNRALNVWTVAMRYWNAWPETAKTNLKGEYLGEQISMNLAHAEEATGNLPKAIKYLKIVKAISPDPEGIQKFIDADEKKLASNSGPTNSAAH